MACVPFVARHSGLSGDGEAAATGSATLFGSFSGADRSGLDAGALLGFSSVMVGRYDLAIRGPRILANAEANADRR